MLDAAADILDNIDVTIIAFDPSPHTSKKRGGSDDTDVVIVRT